MVLGVLGCLGYFNGPHNGYANSEEKIKFAKEVASNYR